MFSFLLGIVLGLAAFGIFYIVFFHLPGMLRASREAKVITPKAKLSWPARELVREFNRIPEANRPPFDIEAIVNALDVKHGVDNADNHFGDDWHGRSWNGRGTTHRSTCIDYGRPCKFSDYTNLHKRMADISTALAHREKELALARVETDLSEAEMLAKTLEDEKEAILSGTKDMISA